MALMFAPYHSAQLVGCFAFLIAAIWAGMMGLMWARKVTRWTRERIAQAVGLGLYVLVITPVMIWFAWPEGAGAQTPPAINGNCNQFGPNNGPINNNCNNTFNYGPRKLQFTDALKTFLLSKLPKDKPGVVNIIGMSQGDQITGHQILDFLMASGYKARLGETSGMTMPMPDKPLTLSEPPGGNSWMLTVAAGVMY